MGGAIGALQQRNEIIRHVVCLFGLQFHAQPPAQKALRFASCP